MRDIAAMASESLSETVVVWSLLVPSVVLGIWAFIDVLRRSADEFLAIGRSRNAWIAILIALGLTTFFALVAVLAVLAAATFYLIRVRTQLNRSRGLGVAHSGR